MKLNLDFINADLIFKVLKWGAILGVVATIYFGIKDIGKNEQVVKDLKQDAKVTQEKIEVKDEVHKTISRVSSDPVFRGRVRELYDAGEPE